jgi:class 3 adenylate cyclase
VKSTGDGSLTTFDGPARAVRAVGAIERALNPLGLPIRGGLHAGEVEIRGEDIGGIAVQSADGSPLWRDRERCWSRRR